MDLRRVAFVVIVVVGCGLAGCTRPPPLSPEAQSVTVNDGRSIEHCASLGIVSATLPASTAAWPPFDRFLAPQLRDRTAERGGNYLEAMPVECSRYTPCAESGVAYRCPDSASSADTKAI